MTQIRLAQPKDSARIAELYSQLVASAEINVLPERIKDISSAPNTALFICEHQGAIEGTALVSLCADVMFGFQPFAVVENIIINKDYRGQGLGTLLLQHIEAFCLSKDCSKIMLLSAAHRSDAHRFFERSGFSGSSKRGFIKYRRQFKA